MGTRIVTDVGTLSNESALVSVEGVSKVFGRTRALDDVELRVEAGTVAVLSGANGSGKSTLLKIVSTVMSPTTGSATVCGHSTVSESESVRRQIGVLLHEPSVYSELTVRENLELFGRLCRMSDTVARVAELVRGLDLERHLEVRVRLLSHGMRKRVGLAIATLHVPRVLVFDEPETGLDAATVEYVAGQIASVRDRGGCCVVSSHNADFARRVGTDFYRLSRGKLSAERLATT